MTWKSYLYPQTVTRLTSSYNSDIRIVETFGRLKLLVAGSPQSGPYIASMWRKVFRLIHLAQDHKLTVLVLGVGGGTVIHLVRRLYPNSYITAVDIDRTMIEIGIKYFSLDSIPLLSFVIEDAKKYVKKAWRLRQKFDLVIVDIFNGPEIPQFVAESRFLREVKALTSPSGFVAINYLREKGYRQKSDVLLDKLRRIFHSVIERKIFLNRFFVCTD